MANKTISEKWFEDNIFENQEELMSIGRMASRLVNDRIALDLNDDTGKKTIAIYCNIFDSILEVIKARQDSGSEEFELNIADRLIIGFKNDYDEDDEKEGNFMVYMKHREPTRSDESMDDDVEGKSTISLSTQWNAINVTAQIDIIKEVALKGRKKLEEFVNIKTESIEFIIPLFSIIHTSMLSWLKLKRAELQKPDFEISVGGMYTVGVQLVEFEDPDAANEETEGGMDVKEEIYYLPGISMKRYFKNDAKADGSK